MDCGRREGVAQRERQRRASAAELKSKTRGKQTRGERLTAALSGGRANWAVSSSRRQEGKRRGWGGGGGGGGSLGGWGGGVGAVMSSSGVERMYRDT